MWKTAAAVLAAAAALLAWRLAVERRQPPPPPPSAVQLQFPAPDGAVFGAGNEPLDAALSAGAEELVFVATSNGATQLWRRALASDGAEPISGTDGAREPAWIPGRREVSFFTGDALKRTDLEGRLHRCRHHRRCRGSRLVRRTDRCWSGTRAARWNAGGPARPRRPRASGRRHRPPLPFPNRRPPLAVSGRTRRRASRRASGPRGQPSATLTDADGHAVAAARLAALPTRRRAAGAAPPR